MTLKRLQFVIGCLGLAGCAGDLEVRGNDPFAGTPAVAYSNSVGRWEIHDKSDESRVKIVQDATIASPASAAFGRNVTFGDLPREDYQNAAQAWLASTGRMCAITNGTPIILSQWEFRYSCR